MNDFDCKSVKKLDDFEFLCNGFNPKWLNSCCDDHKSMLIDFVLPLILSEFKDGYKSNRLYLRLLQKIIESIRQHKLTVELKIEHELLDILLNIITQRDDKLSYEAIETLEKYLRLHVNFCVECCSNDCSHLKFVQNKFVGNNAIRMKIKSALMTCIMKYSKNWRPSFEQLNEQYSGIGNVVGRNQAVQFIVSMLDKFPRERDIHLPLLKNAIADSTSDVFIGVKDRLLPHIFKRNELKHWFLSCCDQICEDTDILALLSISLLMVEADAKMHWSNFLSESRFVQALLHYDNNVRITAFRLLCFHQKSSADVQLNDLKLVEAFILTNMTTPTMRNEICATLKKFLIRISTNVQLKYRNGTMNDELLKAFKLFLTNIHEHAVDSLLKNSNFNRRIMSLTLLGLFHIFGIFNVTCQDESLYSLIGLFDLVNSRLFEALLKSIEFSYDLVQTLALNLIEKIDFDVDEKAKETLIQSVLEDADNISTDVQHKVHFQAKVIGLKFSDKLKMVLDELVTKCKQRIENASLSLIASDQSVHTLLNVISSLLPYVSFDDLEFASYLHTNVIDLCFEVTKIVDPMLQHISPEGILLNNDLDLASSESQQEKCIPELVFGQRLKARTLLVGCWRTLKSASSIFASVVELVPDSFLLNRQGLLLDFKRYFWTQLTVCRHRGVFEQAARGFQTLCERYSNLFANDETNELNPLNWLQEIITAISGGIDAKLLCSTRRSAGLPHLITAILKSYQPNSVNKLNTNIHLDNTLIKLCECRSLEPVFETHSVNVLKSLLHNTIFRRQIAKHLENVLLLTFDGLNSSNWSIRNAYAQLFSALILRIFGSENFNTIGSGITLNEFATSFPLAYEALLKLLSCFDPLRESTEPIVQPILIILSHLRPSNWNDDIQMSSLLADVHNIAFNSKRETVRTLAVQSITSIVGADLLFDKYSLLYQRLLSDFNSLSNNTLSSLFQLINNLLERMQDQENLTALVSYLNVLFEGKFDLLSKNDLTAFHFLHTIKITLDRNFSIDLRQLFNDFKLNDGQLVASTPLLAQLYIKYCVEQDIQIDFHKLPNNFSLSCIEVLLMKRQSSRSIDIFDVLVEAKERRNFLMIRRIINLLRDDEPKLFQKLIENGDFCDWMTEHDLVLLKMNLQLGTKCQVSSNEWKSIEEIAQNCTVDIAFKILHLFERMINTNGMNEFIEKQIAVFLQNEDPDIRSETALLISPSLCPTMGNTLNSAACWLVETQRYPEILKQARQLNEQILAGDINLASEVYEVDDETRIFEPISKNTFVEPFVLKRETQAVNELLKRI